MSSSFPVSVLDADRQPGKAPILLAEAHRRRAELGGRAPGRATRRRRRARFGPGPRSRPARRGRDQCGFSTAVQQL